MIDHDQQLQLEPPPAPQRRSKRGTAEDMRARREVLRANRGRVLTVEQIEEQLARRAL